MNDDELITISKSVYDKHIRNAFIVGNLSRTYDTPVDKLILFFKQYGTQERLKGRLIQAEASLDKWNFYMDENIGNEFDTFLKGQIDSHFYELTALKDKENK